MTMKVGLNMYVWMNEWTNERTNDRTTEWTDWRTDGWTDGQMNEWINSNKISETILNKICNTKRLRLIILNLIQSPLFGARTLGQSDEPDVTNRCKPTPSQPWLSLNWQQGMYVR